MITLGKKFKFEILDQDYDGPIEDTCEVYAQTYTEALDTLNLYQLKFVRFLGESN